MNVLIADDDRLSRRLLETAVARMGHDVTSVSDGNAALAALKRPDGPRLAILDWMMPGIDGPDICRQIRREASHYVYVILLTARDRREDMLAGFEAESDDFLTKPLDVLELRARLRSGERVLTLQHDLLAAQRALSFEATHDALTGLWNRRAILDTLEREARRMAREGRALAIGLIDLDHFKQINDSLGHVTGDDVLREAARRMLAATREHEPLGRYGGEEFLMILPGAEGAVAAKAVDRLRDEVTRRPMPSGGGQLRITVSAGVAWARDGVEHPRELVQLADWALYRAKHRGRNRVELAPMWCETVAVGLASPLSIAPAEVHATAETGRADGAADALTPREPEAQRLA